MAIAPVAAAATAAPPVTAPTARPSFGALVEAQLPFPAPASAAPSVNPALAALERVERAQARLDAVLAAARNGRTFTAAELLGLQAEAYRCAQTVDLASKIAEQGAQSVKHALNTQL